MFIAIRYSGQAEARLLGIFYSKSGAEKAVEDDEKITKDCETEWYHEIFEGMISERK